VRYEVEVNLRPTVSRPARPGVRRPSETCEQFFFHLKISFRQLRVCYFVAPLWREDGSVIYRTIASGPCQNSHSWVEIPQNWNHILMSHLRLLQPGGQGSRIYILQEQGGPVIPPSTGFPFCRLLRLAGQRWGDSNPPSHGAGTKLELEFFLRPTVSRPVHLGIGPPFGTLDQILSCSSFFDWQLRYSSFKASFLTRKRVCSLQCNHSLVRSLTPNNQPYFIVSSETVFPFCRLLRLAGTAVEVF
jgi:hypothetical protein